MKPDDAGLILLHIGSVRQLQAMDVFCFRLGVKVRPLSPREMTSLKRMLRQTLLAAQNVTASLLWSTRIVGRIDVTCAGRSPMEFKNFKPYSPSRQCSHFVVNGCAVAKSQPPGVRMCMYSLLCILAALHSSRHTPQTQTPFVSHLFPLISARPFAFIALPARLAAETSDTSASNLLLFIHTCTFAAMQSATSGGSGTSSASTTDPALECHIRVDGRIDARRCETTLD